MEREGKIFIIIINYNGLSDTLKCLKSLEKVKVEKYKVKTLVIDNASQKNELAVIHQRFHKVITVQNNQNLGFTGANNLGVNRALKEGADYLLLLNNDTVVTPDFLRSLIHFIHHKKRVGVIAPVMLLQREGRMVYNVGGKIRPFGRCPNIVISALEGFRPKKVDYVCGAGLFTSREVIEKVGLLDDNYFFGFEDIDYCQRAKKLGYEIWIDPQAVITHKEGGSLKETAPLKIYYNLRNNLIFVTKFFNIYQKTVALFYLVSISLKICTNNRFFYRPVYWAWYDFLTHRSGKVRSDLETKLHS